VAYEAADAGLLGSELAAGIRRVKAYGALTMESIQQREEHWVVADLVGNAGHVRTVPIPHWVKSAIDAWAAAGQAGIEKLAPHDLRPHVRTAVSPGGEVSSSRFSF